MASAAIESGYAPAGDLQLYYEIRGSGDPLIVLHGAIGSMEMFGDNLARIAERRRVISVDLQGHGRTGDIDRPLRYEAMADDIAGLLDHLDLGQADVLGYSLGGGVAMATGVRHRARVRRLGWCWPRSRCGAATTSPRSSPASTRWGRPRRPP
jgi:pimeloyl-ACP methyl ester carboxylesterase